MRAGRRHHAVFWRHGAPAKFVNDARTEDDVQLFDNVFKVFVGKIGIRKLGQIHDAARRVGHGFDGGIDGLLASGGAALFDKSGAAKGDGFRCISARHNAAGHQKPSHDTAVFLKLLFRIVA